jgi:hypothetical protein
MRYGWHKRFVLFGGWFDLELDAYRNKPKRSQSSFALFALEKNISAKAAKIFAKAAENEDA